jgi:uncharacterized membrane protein YbhN (UPF0104 family)
VKNVLRIAISIGVSFAILALLLQLINSGLDDQQRPGVIAALQASSIKLLLVFFVIYLVTLVVRALRYQLLIKLSGEENVPTLPEMALVTGVRNMVVDMFPARLGELGYVGLLNRGYGVGLQHCVSSLTISIAFDFLALLFVAILIVVKQFVGEGVENWVLSATAMAFVLSLIACGFVFNSPFCNFLAKAKIVDFSRGIKFSGKVA